MAGAVGRSLLGLLHRTGHLRDRKKPLRAD